MDLRSLLGLKKKKVSTKKKVTRKKNVREKTVATEGIEDPVFTVSRQLTLLQENLTQIDTVMRSGFKGLREDHHKILDEQASKLDLEEFKKNLVKKKEELEKVREKVEEEIGLLDIDNKILELLEKRTMRSVEVAEELKIARQYAASRLSRLEQLGYVSKRRKGRNISYKIKKD